MPREKRVDQKGRERTDRAEQGASKQKDEPGDGLAIVQAANEKRQSGAAGRGASNPPQHDGAIEREDPASQSALMAFESREFLRVIRLAIQAMRYFFHMIGYPGQTCIEERQEGGHAGQHENRGQRGLDDMRNAVDGFGGQKGVEADRVERHGAGAP